MAKSNFKIQIKAKPEGFKQAIKGKITAYEDRKLAKRVRKQKDKEHRAQEREGLPIAKAKPAVVVEVCPDTVSFRIRNIRIALSGLTGKMWCSCARWLSGT